MHKLSRSSCLICGTECKRHTTKYCSYKCYNKFRKDRKNKRISKIKTLKNSNRAKDKERNNAGRKSIKQCLWCDRLFYPYHNSMKSCSKTCAAKYRFHEQGDTLFMENGIKAARNMTSEQREKLAIAMSKRNKRQGYTKGIGGIRKDIGHYVRSRWEANVCRLLKHVGIPYEFEPDTFKLSEGENRYTYTPDIKISRRIYIEVKGWESPKARIKKRLMKEQYPDIEIIYITEKEYKPLSKQLRDIIPNWEFDKNHGR